MAHQDNNILGMMAGLGAFFMFAIMQTFAKILSEHHHVVEIAFYRNLVGVMPFIFLIFVLKKHQILKIQSKPKMIVVRSIVGTISLIVTFAAYSVMPMAETTAFLFTSSLFIPILSILFLAEKVGIQRWSAIIIGFVGVLVMLSPNGNITKEGVILALSAAFLHALLQVILRALGKTEKPETVTFYFVLIGTIVAGVPMIFLATMPSLETVPLLLGVGLSGVFAQFLISIAYKNAEASIVTVFNYSGIIWATIFGWMFWSDWPTSTILTGAVIVIASNVFIIWRERQIAGKKPIPRDIIR